MKTLLKLFLVFLMPLMALAQYDDAYVNGLKTELENAKNDTIKLEINRLLGFYFQDSDSDIAIGYHQEQLRLAKQLNLKLWEADAYQQVAYCYRWLDNLPASYESYMNALKIAENPSSSENGYGYHNFSFSKSPEDARQSILGMIHYEMASLFARSRLNDEIRSHLFQALKIGEKLQNQKILSLTSRDIGIYYFDNNQPDSAFKYYQKALSHYDGSPYQIQSGIVYEYLSKYYLAEQKIDSAIAYCKKAISLANEEIKLGALTDAQLLLGQIFQQTKQLDSALFYTQKAIKTAESTNAGILFGLGNVQMASIYKSQNKDGLAYDHLEQGKMLLDSINEVYITRLLQFQNLDFDQKIRLTELEKENELTKSRIRMYSLLAGLGIFVLVALLLYRNNRLKQKANKALKTTLSDLKTTQAQLIQSEKMASLGELTAGIAHEIQNPLNFVNNFSEVSNELLEEMKDELDKGAIEEAKTISSDIKQNLEKITHHGKRADAIVKGMLAHSRSSSGEKVPTDINALADEYLRLSYHGLRAKDKTFNADFATDLDPNLPKVNVIPQDIGRVLLNLINNAFQAVASVDAPLVVVSTKVMSEGIEISVKDNGTGISNEIKDKIFQPFFTTKPTGQGTGLGLSLSYDIVKAHGGKLEVTSAVGEGTKFIIILET
ncbi:MAG: ATP-binding protein [Flavobacteriaceae bacterium]